MDAKTTRKAAIDAFSEAWTLLEKRDRTPIDDDAMIAAAKRSHELWLKVGEPVNDQRGEWMLARTSVDAGRAGPALRHAARTLELTAAATPGKGGFANFDFAFAEEIAARAFALAGDLNAARRHYANARRLGDAIKDDGDRAEFFRQFAIGPWFGLTEYGESRPRTDRAAGDRSD